MKEIADTIPPLKLPVWTARRETEGPGRDPLGLARVSQRILDAMLPGITTQTSRARYYSFYPWAVENVRHEVGTTSRARFIEAFQRRDAALMLSCLAHHDGKEPLVGLVGSKEGARQWQGRKSSSYGLSFRILPSHPMGAFGQYYRGCLENLGIIEQRDETGIPYATDGLGKELADSFERSIAHSQYLKKGRTSADELDYRILHDLGKIACLCRLGLATPEQDLLRKVFFLQRGGAAKQKHPQRETLTLLLDLIDFYARTGSPVPLKPEPSSWLLRRTLYYGQGSGRSQYQPPLSLEHTARIRQVFQAHWLFRVFLEHLAKAVLDILDAEQGGLPLEGISRRLIEARSFVKVVRGADTLQTLIQKICAGGLSVAASQAFARTIHADSQHSELSFLTELDERAEVDPGGRAGLALRGLPQGTYDPLRAKFPPSSGRRLD